MWKNVVERGRPRMTIWRVRIACWIPKATHSHTHIHTGCVVLLAFPLQQLLHERALMLRYTNRDCFVSYTFTCCMRPVFHVTCYCFLRVGIAQWVQWLGYWLESRGTIFWHPGGSRQCYSVKYPVTFLYPSLNLVISGNRGLFPWR